MKITISTLLFTVGDMNINSGQKFFQKSFANIKNEKIMIILIELFIFVK